MKVEKFLSLNKPGFHVAKISQNDVRAEDVLEYFKERDINIPTIYLPDYLNRYVSVAAIAYALLPYLDEEFYLTLGGLMGTVFQSLLPSEELPGEYDVYPDIHERVVFYALYRAMDYIAHKYQTKKVLWVFGRIDFSRDYRYRRFIEFLGKQEKLDTGAVHLCVVADATAKDLDFPELDDVEINSRYSLEKLLSLPFTGKHRKLLGMLALISDNTSAHITVSFIARLINHYPWAEEAFRDLLHWGVLEHHGDFFYSFTNIAMKDYALRNWVDVEVENMALSLMRRNLYGNMYFVAMLSEKKGDIRKALASITLYARLMVKSGRFRQAYDDLYPYYFKYSANLSKPQMGFFLKLASARDDYDKSLVRYIVDKLMEEEKLPFSVYMYMAIVSPHEEKYVSYWQEMLQYSKKISPSLQRNILILSAFEYLWRSQRITYEQMESIRRIVTCPDVGDPYLKVHLYNGYARLLILSERYKEARELLDVAKDIIEDRMLWFLASGIFNNLFVSLYRDNITYPYTRLVPLLFKAYQSALLYGVSRSTVAFSNYLLIGSQASEPYSSLETMLKDFIPIAELLLGKNVVLDIYYAMSFVAQDYGYHDRSMYYVEKMKEIMDAIGWDRIPYDLKMKYYHAKAYNLMLEGYLSEAEKTLEQWMESIGLYGEGYMKSKVVRDGIKIMRGEIEPGDNSSPIHIYRYYLSRNMPEDGIEHLKRTLQVSGRIGNLLEMAQAKEFMAYFYEMLGDIPSMREHLYDAMAMYYVLESARMSHIQEKLDISLSEVPPDMFDIYVNRMMLTYLFSEIALENTIEDVMISILSRIIIPATGMWMLLQWQNFTDFVGVDITRGITHKFSDFYMSPSDIYGDVPYKVNKSPSYVYVVSHVKDAKLIMYAENRYVEGIFSEDTITSLKVYADNVIGLLLKMKVSERAIVDSLTGLYSRWYILGMLRKEISRYLRNKSPLSLLFIDIDDFKRINDTYGHDVGDSVLAKVGQIIKDSIRIVDMAGRYGGEEFIVILPDTDEEGAFLVAERIRKAILRYIDHDITLSVSIGVATLKDGEVVGDRELIRRADMAMYMAKRMGKNRTVVWNSSDLVE